MSKRKIAQSNVFKKKFLIAIGKMRMTWKYGMIHGAVDWDALAGGRWAEAALWLGDAEVLADQSVSGKLARRAAAGSVGRYRGPC
jgi:hypothetical protein